MNPAVARAGDGFGDNVVAGECIGAGCGAKPLLLRSRRRLGGGGKGKGGWSGLTSIIMLLASRSGISREICDWLKPRFAWSVFTESLVCPWDLFGGSR